MIWSRYDVISETKDGSPIIYKIHITYVYRSTRNNSFKTRGLEKDACNCDVWINHHVPSRYIWLKLVWSHNFYLTPSVYVNKLVKLLGLNCIRPCTYVRCFRFPSETSETFEVVSLQNLISHFWHADLLYIFTFLRTFTSKLPFKRIFL